MKVTIKNFNVNWLEIKNACRQTVSLGDSNKEPTSEWKRKLLLCRHSPIRLGTILFKLEDIPFYVMGHLVRHHEGCEKFVSTSREDRTSTPRSERRQTDLVSMQMSCNLDSLMSISEKRLCLCADIETIKVWKAVLEAIKEYDEDIYWACVPSCVRMGGCIEEFSNCVFFERLMKDKTVQDVIDIPKRYDIYNEHRTKKIKK